MRDQLHRTAIALREYDQTNSDSGQLMNACKIETFLVTNCFASFLLRLVAPLHRWTDACLPLRSKLLQSIITDFGS